jgi:hypothetical protein
MKKKTVVVKGKIENMKRVLTRTENSRITFTVGGTPCKAFGKGAEAVSRWMQVDPNIVGEFEGYFDKRSEKFGREFVAVHGKAIQTERIDNANRLVMAASVARAPGAAYFKNWRRLDKLRFSFISVSPYFQFLVVLHLPQSEFFTIRLGLPRFQKSNVRPNWVACLSAILSTPSASSLFSCPRQAYCESSTPLSGAGVVDASGAGRSTP